MILHLPTWEVEGADLNNKKNITLDENYRSYLSTFDEGKCKRINSLLKEEGAPEKTLSANEHINLENFIEKLNS